MFYDVSYRNIHIQHQVLGYMYYGVDYVNKESKNIDYRDRNLLFYSPHQIKSYYSSDIKVDVR